MPDAVSLTAVVERALEDPPEAQEARERALELVYAHRSGAAERAAKVLVDWAKGAASEDDPVAPVGAPVGPRGADTDGVVRVADAAIDGPTEATA